MFLVVVEMAEISSPNNLSEFIELFKVEKGCEFTHTSMASPCVSFYVPVEEVQAFYNHYITAVNDRKDLYITEKNRHVGPIVVDFDFRYEGKQLTRKHSEQVIEQLVHMYVQAITEYIRLPPSMRVFVMERDAPYHVPNKNFTKDGIHFVIPDIITRASIKRFIRTRFMTLASDLLSTMGNTNSMEDIVDEAVIARNNWFMYGSKKPGTKPYKVTYVYQLVEDSTLKTIQQTYTNAQLVSILSIRNKYLESEVVPEKMEEIELIDEKEEIERRKHEASKAIVSAIRNEKVSVTPDDIEHIKKLVKILNPARASTYHDWIRLGWCLRNIDSRLLEDWVEFSKQSNKYQQGECERLWDHMKEGGLGMGTLHMWAKQDNEVEYANLMRTSLRTLIQQSMTGTPYDAALVIHHMYKHTFVCASAKNRTWYEFKNHRWQETDSGLGLRVQISDAVWKEYLRVANDITSAAILETSPAVQTQLQENAKRIQEIATKLRQTAFKENIMKECIELFYVEKFEEKLDSNPNLIGFENGVYDLELMEFREGRPEDFISFSTKINYIPYDPKHPNIAAIQHYLSQVFTKPHIRSYVLKLFASFLSGHLKEQKFYIWTGSGANSKSIIVNLFEKSFGEYCCKFPVSLLTQKRAASNAATGELTRAKGKRFACLQEPGEDEKLNIGLMKELSGGDKIMARALYKDPIEFRPMFKLLLLCNNLPNVPSDDGGTWRRIRVVEFTSKFVDNPSVEGEFKIDYELAEKMQDWPEHFMALLLQTYKQYVLEGIIEPEEVLKCTLEYKAQNDHIALYLLHRVENKDSSFLTMDDVYLDFKQWVKDDGITMVRMPSKSEIEKYMVRNGYKLITVSGTRGFKGMRIKPTILEEEVEAE